MYIQWSDFASRKLSFTKLALIKVWIHSSVQMNHVYLQIWQQQDDFHSSRFVCEKSGLLYNEWSSLLCQRINDNFCSSQKVSQTFLHCLFLNVSSKRIQTHIDWFCSSQKASQGGLPRADFSPWWVFKCLLKWPAWKNTQIPTLVLFLTKGQSG